MVPGSELARKIISNFTSSGPRVRNDYLEHLKSRSLSLFGDNDSALFGMQSKRDVLRGASYKMVERVYHLLEPYVVELNRALEQYGVRIACTEPDETSEADDGEWPFKPPEIVNYYRARFSTSKLSVIVRAFEEKVEFFLLPVDQIMRLSIAEDEAGALMTFTAKIDGGMLDWEVEGKSLTDDRFERYCILLFDHFISQTQKELVKAS